MSYRIRVLGLLCLLMIITYVDRVCISVAGPRIQEALQISPIGWGWVTGVFTISYAAFEIPSGAMGDFLGPRRVLTRIVTWWSAFTTLTGLVTGYYPLLAVRFLFGMGEAGAFPNSSVAISRWFPFHQRSRAMGVTLMASQIGGALTPLLVVPLQANYGWRNSFYVFGAAGLAWSALWYWWFRDSPAEMKGVSAEEAAAIGAPPARQPHAMPWGRALRSLNLWAILGVAFCYVYGFYFFQSWFHTYLVKGRGYKEESLWLSSLPFVVAAFANFAGGMTSSYLVQRIGLCWGRRAIGIAGLSVAAIATLAILIGPREPLVIPLLCVIYGGITFQQPIMFTVCLDVGGRHAGAVVGAMNTAAMTGSFLSSIAFGYLVYEYGNYNAPFVPMAGLLMLGACLWLAVDPRKLVAPEDEASATL